MTQARFIFLLLAFGYDLALYPATLLLALLVMGNTAVRSICRSEKMKALYWDTVQVIGMTAGLMVLYVVWQIFG